MAGIEMVAVSALLWLVSQPGFWFCLVALVCANIVAESIRRGLRTAASQVAREIYLTRVAPARYDEQANEYDDREDVGVLPEIPHV